MTRQFFLSIIIVTLCLTFSSFDIKSEQSSDNGNPIKIGLLVPADTSTDFNSQQYAHAAMLAVDHYNKNSGIKGQKVQLIVKSCDGKWGSGSKQAVDLIYNDGVKVIVGALDGRNAHLAEQVATKAQVVFLSTQATDPTLSKINIPWYFRCIYNEDQRSEALVDELYASKNALSVAVISEESYDDNLGSTTFIKKLKETGMKMPKVLSKDDFLNLGNVEKKGFDIFIYFGEDIGLKQLANIVDQDTKIYCSAPNNISLFAYYDNLYVPVYSNQITQSRINFSNQYKNRYGIEPGIDAAYTYDGLQLIIDIMISESTGSEFIRKGLINASYKGNTGVIAFNESGNRKGKVKFISFTNFTSK